MTAKPNDPEVSGTAQPNIKKYSYTKALLVPKFLHLLA